MAAFNAAKLSQKNKNIASAFADGLEWIVIKHDVEMKYPELPALVQRAKNKVGATQRRPDMWQTIAHVQKLSTRQKSPESRSCGLGGHIETCMSNEA